MKTLNYDVSALNSTIRAHSEEKLSQVLAKASEDVYKTFGYRGVRGGQVRRQYRLLVSAVDYGFKAPVAMTVIPLIVNVAAPLAVSFLHVVRDGRDMAFSGNQVSCMAL